MTNKNAIEELERILQGGPREQKQNMFKEPNIMRKT